jgi:hypothetical protein
LKDWKSGDLIVAGLGDFAQAPLRTSVFLGVLPGVWMAPAYLAASRTSVVANLGAWLLTRIGTAIWGSALAGGVFLAALNLVRRVRFGPHCFIDGLRYWPRITALDLVLSLPSVLLSLTRPLFKADFFGKGLVVLVVTCGAIFCLLVIVRTVAAVLVVVDRDAQLVDALSASWHSTANAKGRVAVLVLIFAVPAAVWGILWKSSPIGQQVGWVVLRPVCILVWVRLYLQLQTNMVLPGC